MQMIGSRRRFESMQTFVVLPTTAAALRSGCLQKLISILGKLLNVKKWAFQGKFIDGGGQKGTKENKVSLLWAASTAANVTNASFKSSTGPLPTT